MSARVPPHSSVDPRVLAQELQDSHRLTLACHADLAGTEWLGPYLPIVNPPLWELGHVAWFLEHWCLRRNGEPSRMAHADALYDSSRIAHAARWFLPLPSPAWTCGYLTEVTETVVDALKRGTTGDDALYFVELALYHQDMHNEAFCYTRQTLGRANPFPVAEDAPGAAFENGDVSIPAGSVMLGSRADEGFLFDNEKWAHEVPVPAFAIARAPVSNADYLAFVEAGGYDRRELWNEEAWRWRERTGRRHPVYWRRTLQGWRQRVFDAWRPLEAAWPVAHVNAYEAEAWCRWAGRRLPTEAEWERAAAMAPESAAKRRHPWGDAPRADAANLASGRLAPAGSFAAGDSAWGCRQMLGNVWEWTATAFAPYPGFAPDPYRDYSQPWFGTHRVLRGGSFATQPRLARNAYRNFYTPERADIIAGFRTCAP